MDAVELVLPEPVVSVSELMGSEGFSGGGDVGRAVGKVRAGLPEGNSVIVQPSFDASSQKAKVPPVHAAAAAFRHKIHDARHFAPDGQPTSFHGSYASEDLKLGNVNPSQSLSISPEAKQLHRRSGKVSRCNSGGSKRSRIVQLELSMNESGVEDIKGNSSATGSSPAKCIVAEKTQMTKQRNSSNSKRSDKRNGGVPKGRCDYLKNGFVSFSSVAGGNFFEYGSKSDIFDVTKLIDELPLNELLDGSYNCPTLVKDKGEAVENSNMNLLHSVRKACYLLRLQKPVHTQISADTDKNNNQKLSVGPLSSGACPTSWMESGKADSCTVNQPSSNKDSCRYKKSSAIAVDSPLCPPKDILERLALPPSKDLDSVLLDAVKPASSSRKSTDPRLGKTVSHRTGLPPFHWSYNSAGHSKSASDAVKLPAASRTACPGRWVKVGNTLTALKGSHSLLVDLNSLTYDHRLVPSGYLESAPMGVDNASSMCADITSNEWVVSSSAECSAFRDPPVEYSPRRLAAAKTLCEIASDSLKQNSHEMMKWLKNPSQKTMKACKLKLTQKSEKRLVTPKASIGHNNLVKVADGMFPAKKLRLSVDEKTDAVCHTNPACKGPTNWSAPLPRSMRPSPSKLFRDLVPEMKSHNNHAVKRSFMMPPPTRVIDKACNNRQKLKKIVSMEWNTTASNLDS